jgi:cytoskeletal protein RodZ
MLKNKTTLAIGGIMTLVGALGGTALMASAQTASTSTNIPAATTSTSSTTNAAVDTPESANDPADTDTPESANDPADTNTGTTLGHNEGANDTDGGAASETSESSSTSDTADQ